MEPKCPWCHTDLAFMFDVLTRGRMLRYECKCPRKWQIEKRWKYDAKTKRRSPYLDVTLRK